jgi:hypothetical protein
MSCDPDECKPALQSAGGQKVGFSCTPRGCSNVKVLSDPSLLTFNSSNNALWKLKCNKGTWKVTPGANGNKCECVDASDQVSDKSSSDFDTSALLRKPLFWGILAFFLVVVVACIAGYRKLRTTKQSALQE